ncbi:MAG: gliding motility-associated C-terminal domain-containing protein [Crocinitomicaceae bacterium]|nr:gliding motility-associated C-terminal domain-containing protein [Crocinitomicaceae bacterium]
MRSLLLLASLFIFLNPCILHAQDVDWLISAGGLKSDKGTTIVVDDDGNSYITGYYNEEADFGPYNTGFSFQQSKEVFVAKVDPQGNYLWVTNGINYFDDRGLGLCIDQAGNIYVTGTCWGGLDWGSLSVYNPQGGTDQIFVVKLDNNGNEIWMKNAGNGDGSISSTINENGNPQTLYQDDHGQDLACDSQGNIYLTGFLSNIDTNPHSAIFDAISIPLDPEDSVAFLAKMDNNGNWLWVETFEGIHQHRDNAIGIDDDDNVYVTGGFIKTRTFGTTVLTSGGGEDIYVVKFDGNGNMLFASQAGGILDDRGDGITYGHDGHMYITGEFRDHCFFDGIDLNNYGGPNGKDCFVAKISKSGDWVWAKKAGSKKGSDRGTGICANKQFNIFVSGQFRGDAKFGNLELDSESDIDSVQFFVAAIDTAGVWRWVVDGGGSDFDRAADVDCDTSCNVYFMGYFTDNATAQTETITSAAGKDIFVGKITDACFGYSPPTPPISPEELLTCEYLPSNVFSPNNDQVNDEFSFSDFCSKTGEVVVVNRWGNIVYQSTDILENWNGKDLLGNHVRQGTYFYRIEAIDELGKTETKSGFITLVD